MRLYNLILEDTIIEDIPLEEAMDVARMYAEVEARGVGHITCFISQSVGYEYRVIENENSRIVATIEVSRKD